MESNDSTNPHHLRNEDNNEGCDSNIVYCRNPSMHCKTKKDYIIKLVSLLFMRGIKFKEFNIGCNVDGAEMFGDIAIKIVDDIGNSKILLIHIYLPQNDSMAFNVINSNDQLNMSSCFKHINMVRENFKSCRTLRSLGSFEDCEFILYTGATILETPLLCSNNCLYTVLNTGKSESVIHSIYDVVHRETVKCLEELQVFKKFLEDIILLQNANEISEKLHIFREHIHTKEIKGKLQILGEMPTQETVKVLYTEMENTQCIEGYHDSVLLKFRLYAEQASEERMNSLITNEILQTEGVSNFGVHIIYKYLLKEIEVWWTSCSYYLKNNSNIWKKFISKLKCCSKIQKPCVESISDLGIRFFIFSTKTIKGCVLQYRVLNIIASSHDISLTCLKVHQVLEHIASCKYLWISFTTLLDWKDDVLQTWFSDPFSILVIENKTDHENFRNTVSEIAQILRMDAKKYVIIISAEINKFTSSLKNIVFPDDYCELKDNFKFADLDDQSQLNILNHVVQFQGQSISMGSLIGTSTDLKASLSASVVSQLIQEGDSVVIGPPLSERIVTFVPRTLELLVELDISIIKSIAETEVFVVSGTALPELRKILNEYILSYSPGNEVNDNSRLFWLESSSNGELLSLFGHFPFKNVHHLIFRNGALWWRESKGQTKYLKDYLIISENARHIWEVIDKSRTSIYKPQTLLDSIEHQMVILGESGVGKSTFLSTLQKSTKVEAPLHWLIHLNFNNDIKLIVKTKKDDYDCEVIIQIMYSLLKNEHHASEIELILLRHDFEKRGNIIIICEGLDNVNPMYVKKVLEFIHALDTMKVKKLWIASSLSMKSVLEKSFKTVVSEIQPLSSDEQVSFLHSLWEKDYECCGSVQPVYISCKIRDFITCLQRLYSTDKCSLLSCPLICVMIAEIFGTKQTECMSSTPEHWLERIDIAQIYERFIYQRRLHIHKSKVCFTVTCEIHEQEEFFMNRHMLCALFSLLSIPELELLNLLDIFENVSRFVEEVKRFGIIQSIVNKKPVFLHKSFAEYFAAMWFSKNIEKSREFLKQKIFASNFRSVLRFFDYFLIKGHELHTATLKHDYQGVESLLAYGVDSSSTDKGGRTALHLAILYSQPSISSYPIKDFEDDSHDCITKLLVNHSNTKMIDSVLLWRPIQYAIELRKWDAMDLLLKDQIDFNDIDCLKEKVKDELFVHEGMQIGSEKGYFNLIESFTCSGINIAEYVIETNEGQYNPLHLAAKYGQLKLVRYLLSKGVKISIKDNKGISPLHLAASEGMTEVLVYLLQRGADLHCTDRDGNTPLNFAILKNDLHTIILLIEQYPSNINFQNKFGDTSLHHAVKVGDITVIEYLLMKEVQIDTCNRDGNTALHLAVWIGALPVVKVLLDYGANVNAINKCGDTPLSRCAGDLEIVQILVTNGADVNKKNDVGNTALHWAARQNNERVVEYLLNKGADLNAQNRYGNTPLHRAVEHGCLGTTKFLINAGCNIKLQNIAGCTAVKMRSRSKEVADCVSCL